MTNLFALSMFVFFSAIGCLHTPMPSLMLPLMYLLMGLTYKAMLANVGELSKMSIEQRTLVYNALVVTFPLYMFVFALRELQATLRDNTYGL
jgi:hypothetical protein